MTVRAYLSILIPFASGLLCHWRYRRLTRRTPLDWRTLRRERALHRTAWFAYGMATSSAALFVIWAVT